MIRERGRGLVLAVGVLGVIAAGCSANATLAPTAPPTTEPVAAATPAGAATPGVTSDPPAPAPADTNPANCATSELKGSLGPAEGAAGSVVQTLLLTNVGTRTCELRGFPGVSYVAGEDGHQVGPAATMSGPRGGEVQLAPGKSAGAALKLVNVQNYDTAVCKPTAVRGLRVYPPGDTSSLYVPREGTGCAGTPPGDQISVQTVTAQ
jgi:hypothetical protein